MKFIVSNLLEELRNEKENLIFSKNDLEDLNFFDIFKLIICNLAYLMDEDMIYDLIWCMGILISNNEELQLEYLKEKKAFEILFYLLHNNTNYKIQSMVFFLF